MSLFGTLIKHGSKYADNLFDDVAVQAKYVDDGNGYFDEKAWINSNPMPDGGPSSNEVKAWRARKRKAKENANSTPTDRAPYGFDSLGRRIMSENELAYIRTNPRPYPDTPKRSLSPEQSKEYKKWEYGLRKAKYGQQHIRDLNNESYQTNKDSIQAGRRAKRAARTPEEIEADREKEKARRDNPEEKKRRREYGQQHYRDNKGHYAVKTRARAQGAKDQTPAHMNRDAVNEIFRRRDELNAAARASGSDMEFVVDHVVPLTGHRPGVAVRNFTDETRTVSGLNVQDNLLIVPRELNASKGGWFEPGNDPMRQNEVARRRLLQQAEEGLLGPLK